MSREVADCRDFPNEKGCTLTIAGEEGEVIRPAAQHAVAVHGHEDNEELRSWLKDNLENEVSA
jgi:predicted small metal-binding protein